VNNFFFKKKHQGAMTSSSLTEIFPIHSFIRLKNITQKSYLNGNMAFILEHDPPTNNPQRMRVKVLELEGNPGPGLQIRIQEKNCEKIPSALWILITPQLDGTHIVNELENMGFVPGVESHEMIGLKKKLKWGEGITSCLQSCYSKYSPYPDLFFYWNSMDTTSPPNFASYWQTRPVGSIRGQVVVVRAEGMTMSFSGVSSLRSKDPTPWTPQIAFDEISDTIEFFKTHTYLEVDHPRFMKRKQMQDGIVHAYMSGLPLPHEAVVEESPSGGSGMMNCVWDNQIGMERLRKANEQECDGCKQSTPKFELQKCGACK
jgi:hypothetical protein